MTLTVKVGEAKTHLSELLAKVEAGEDVIIARGNDAVARLVRTNDVQARKQLIETLRSERAARVHVTADEIRDWKT
ncbi:prevent-host-death family protein [Agrobacterium larrymoorei]|uniref:Antitoxin n=2 Tax=Agrobacterium TaxID=357 RepID=A0AAJ2B7X5_9HYPH|nr:type II toxin-antitoxin system prevent-host-death family antitoxin [Agrobacterium larrymoorei]MDR6101055.1 prevent-host-death family protein [Agrobacterium larrymoorei]